MDKLINISASDSGYLPKLEEEEKKKNGSMSKYEQFLELILENIDSHNDLGEEVSEQEGHLIQFSSWMDF